MWPRWAKVVGALHEAGALVVPGWTCVALVVRWNAGVDRFGGEAECESLSPAHGLVLWNKEDLVEKSQ
jgi:hypothetical protein